MALETLKNITEINGEKIIVMDKLREKFLRSLKMTDKELNELRDKLNKQYSLEHLSIYRSSGSIAFDAGFDAAVKALKDNYVEKHRVEKLVEALKSIAWVENENLDFSTLEDDYYRLKEVIINDTLIARQAIEEFEK